MREQPRGSGLPGALRVLIAALATLIGLELALQGLAWVLAGDPQVEQVQPDPDATRVLVLGDSWTVGSDAGPGEGFVARTAAALADRGPVQLLNLGLPGSNSAHAALNAMDTVPTFRPHMVWVLVGQNNGSSFARVAELEERLGAAGSVRWWDELRLVKLARIIAANWRGRWGGPGPAAQGDPGPLALGPLDSPTGRAYVQREPLPPDAPAAWGLLYGALEPGAAAPGALRARAERLAAEPDTAGDPVARYALLRLAVVEGRWGDVRAHGEALEELAGGTVLGALGGVEVDLLAGRWRRAAQRIEATLNALPGFPDAQRVGARVPPAATSWELLEQLERPPAGRYLDSDWSRIGRVPVRSWEQLADGVAGDRLDPEALGDVERDRLALWLAELGRSRDAARVASERPRGAWAVFQRSEAPQVDDAALAAWLDGGPLPVDGLGRAARVWVERGRCDRALPAVEAWFRARGDGAGFVGLASRCGGVDEAIDRLDALRGVWGAAPQRRWEALLRAGRRPEALLLRDLDLILEQAQAAGAQLVLLNYPVDEVFDDLRVVLDGWAASRPVLYVDIYSDFRRRLDEQAWAARMAPGGHCNAEGYGEMARALLDALDRSGRLPAAVAAPPGGAIPERAPEAFWPPW